VNIPRKESRKHGPSKVNRTFLVPTEMDARMRTHPDVNWSALLRDTVEKALKQLEAEKGNK
jgi:hypothetical protein